MIMKSPESIIEALAHSLPGQATLFMNYVIVQTALTPVFDALSHFIDLIIWRIQVIGKPKDQRKHTEQVNVKRYFAENYSKELLVATIGFTYSTIAPFILLFVTIYFAFSYIAGKYNWIYIYNARYEGARLTRLVIDRIVVALVLYQLTTMGVLGLSLFIWAPLILFAIIGTIIFRVFLFHRFNKPSLFLALDNCPDQPEILEDEDQEDARTQHSLFIHPALREAENIQGETPDYVLTHEDI